MSTLVAGLAAAAGGMAVPQPRPRVAPLVSRMTFGADAEELSLYTGLGAAGYIEYHLNHEAIADSAIQTMLQLQVYNLLALPPEQFVNQNGSNCVSQLQRSTILREIFTRRQLYERMVEFWSDHFNIWASQDGVQLLKIPDDRDVIRASALGNFGTLLRASAHSPAMLEYLNNDQNIAAAPNENYARELMELHTLGVDGGYTQQDVIEVARCFTGWTYWRAGSVSPPAYTFRYNTGNVNGQPAHDTGQKVIFAGTPQQLVIPSRPVAQGQQDGEDVLTALINHPSTARFIARKMLVRFWGYDPTPGMIDLVAAAYTSSGADIKSMMRVVLGFVAASAPPLKLKRPLHLLVSAIRALEPKVTSHANFPSSVQTPLLQAGHLPFNWQPPDGYPDSVSYWAGGELPRWNFGADLLTSPGNALTPAYSGISLDVVGVLAGAVTPVAVADRINAALFNGTMGAADLDAITAYLGPGNPTMSRIREAFTLALASPSFQWY